MLSGAQSEVSNNTGIHPAATECANVLPDPRKPVRPVNICSVWNDRRTRGFFTGSLRRTPAGAKKRPIRILYDCTLK